MKKLDEILAGKKSVGLAGHVRPDGDCVGSTLGVYNYIQNLFYFCFKLVFHILH